MIDLPGYSVTRLLGRGGMASVYLAVQQSLGREVALKVLADGGTADAAVAERFLREARIAASLNHPNIVPVHDFGVHDGVAFIAMAYEPAGSIAPRAGECLEPRAALRVVRDIASALNYAHARGVVHRDVKPDNILRLQDGGATLSDFGIARLIHSESQLTADGTSVGSPHYMSPEQLRGDRIDGRTDLYSLGVVFWQLVTGELPYRGPDAWSIGTQHLTSEVPALPPGLSRYQPLIDALMAKQAGDRPESGAALIACIAALESAATSPSAAVRTTPVLAQAPTRQAAAPGWWIAMAATATAALAATVWWWQLPDAAQPAPIRQVAAAAPAPAKAGTRSIAVLPFVNMSPDPGNQFFSDGISEELLNILSDVEDMEVASRTSSFAFRGRALGAGEIGRQLGVRYLLEGSVRKAGNKVRIMAKLVDAGTNRQLWSESFDREMTDIFAIQEEIANAIVAATRGSLAPRSSVIVRAGTGDQRAYERYLEARELFLARQDLPRSIKLFEEAIARDSEFARAWEGLASVAVVAGGWGIHDRDYIALADRAAARALELDPTLSMPWAVLGMAERMRMPADWERTLALLDRSIATDPKNATAYHWRGVARIALGQFDAAVADQEKCLALDAAYQNCFRHKALAHLFAGRTREGLALFRLGMDAGFVTSRQGSFLAPLVVEGDVDSAERILVGLGAPAEGRRVVLDVIGQPALPAPARRRALAAVLGPDDRPVTWLGTGRRDLWLGNFDAFAAATNRDHTLPMMWERYPPEFRSSPQFKTMIERAGIATYWRRRGFPPQCHAVGSTGFECP